MLKAFSTNAEHVFLAFSCGTPRGHGYNYSTNCEKKPLKQQFAGKGFRSPDGKKGRGEVCTGSVSACYPLRFGPKLLEEVCRVEIAACLCNQAFTVDPKENGRWECDLSVCGW